MRCPYPRRLKPIYPDHPDGLEVPCGKCFLCRRQRSLEWSLRMYHELTYNPVASFVTLTYHDDYLPPNGSLVKDDPVKFLKRLRKSTPIKIRYYLSGEYGDHTQRPHYHAIIYGLGLNDDHKTLVMRAWPYCDWHQPSIRLSSFGIVEPASIQYVAGYIQKKLTGEQGDLLYNNTGRTPPFSLQSKGIGREYADNNIDQIKATLQLTMRGNNITLPRYYVKRLGLSESLKEQAITKDCEYTEKLVGLYMTGEELYKSAIKEVITYVKADKDARNQNMLNHQTKALMHERSLI